MSILSSQEVEALIKSAKIEDHSKKRITIPQESTSIKKVDLVSDKKEINQTFHSPLEFEKKYPSLESVLGRFLDFLEKTLAKSFASQTKIIYHSVTENNFKKAFDNNKNFFVGYYELHPVASFVAVLFDFSFLEHLLISKLGADVFEKNNPKEIKKKYKNLIAELFKSTEQNWNWAWRQLYPLQTQLIDFLVLADLLATKVRKKQIVQFSFTIKTLGKEYPLTIAFEEKLLTQLSKTKFSISSFLPEKVKKKMFLKKIVKEKVSVSCELGTYRINLQELLGLEKNDIILINFKKGDTIFLSIADEKKFIGKFFAYQDKKAIHLMKEL